VPTTYGPSHYNPPPQKREGKNPYFQVKGPQTAQRTWVGSLVPATHSSCHHHPPQTLPALVRREPPTKPRSAPDAPQCPLGASSSAWRTPGPCCGRSRSSGHTRRRACGQSGDTARCCQPMRMTLREQGKMAEPTACTRMGHSRSLLDERQQGTGPRHQHIAPVSTVPGPERDPGGWDPHPAQSISPSPQTGPAAPKETVPVGLGSYLARAFPGGSMRVCHLEESVSRLGRMWPSRVSVSCCMSRQKMA